MDIYIASSWRNQHAVEMLTDHLEERGHSVVSFVRQSRADGVDERTVSVEEWISSEAGARKFRYDVAGAIDSDVVIYIGPSGTDAWAEVGAAYAAGRPIYGLWAKGEAAGLMRRMMTQWFTDYRQLLCALDVPAPQTHRARRIRDEARRLAQ